MTATDAQVRIAMSERKKGRTLGQAAAKANLRDRETVSKYEKLGKLPSELKRRRTYRTRPDPFAEDWQSVQRMLEFAPTLEAKALFVWLCHEHPGRYGEGQLRTFQRRVGIWRALEMPKMVTLEQERVPGEMMQTDGTSMKKLNVTIQRAEFDHLLIHCVLPYSNWEWGTVAQSESLLALMGGFSKCPSGAWLRSEAASDGQHDGGDPQPEGDRGRRRAR